MSITARDLFYSAYQYAGMIELEQSTLNPDQEEDARRMFNGLVNTLRADGYTVPYLSRQLFNIVPNVGDYTIGVGGDWNTDWPDRLDRAGIVLTAETQQPEYPIQVLTVDEYQSWILKQETTNFPWAIWFERKYPLGIVHLLWVPTDNNQIALYLEHPLSELAIAGGTPPNYSVITLEFQPAYQEALETNLARRIRMRAPQRSRLDAAALSELLTMAQNGMSLIRNAGNRPLSRTTDLSPLLDGRSNVLVGNRWSR